MRKGFEKLKVLVLKFKINCDKTLNYKILPKRSQNF